ncbi:MAG TPA: SpoIIE family protein phosphatase [Fimbriiglobus sp.]|nr:SpoIIE family protein phosphatase [Fimbriiglobus sp.]
MTAPLVLLAAPPGDPADDLRAALVAAGFVVADATPGPPLPDLAPASAVVVSAGPGFVRLLRAELGDHILPVIWVAATPDAIAAGLSAGADAGLVRPVDPAVLVAQVRAAIRVREQAVKLAVRAAEARAINDRLRKVYQQAEADARLVERVGRTVLPRHLPALGGVRFVVCHRPRALSESSGGYDVAQLDADRVGFWVTDAGGVVGLTVRLAAHGRAMPGEVLDRVNRALIGLEIDPPPLVGMTCGLIDARSGAVCVARGGLPPAVVLPAAGDPQPWAGPGPFLGAFDAEFPPRDGVLTRGDRLILATAGDAEGLTAAADRHRGSAGQALAESVAAGLVDAGDAVTVLIVEMSA